MKNLSAESVAGLHDMIAEVALDFMYLPADKRFFVIFPTAGNGKPLCFLHSGQGNSMATLERRAEDGVTPQPLSDDVLLAALPLIENGVISWILLRDFRATSQVING